MSDAVGRQLPKEFVARYGQPLGLNLRLRVLQYDAVDNDVFDPHYDVTTFANDDNDDNNSCSNRCRTCQSLLAVLIYLNQGFVAGETMFWIIPM